jgi:uroporphyrin-III C-methyltransferase
MTGFVSFVSSGPGDPELLTLKAVARLQAADAVLFDDLSSGPILAHVRTGADLVSVGKRAGRVSPRQQHVSRLLVDYATTHAKVVRLKSGDAGIFGRLEEEIEALSAAGIGYEIIPGVTSACAAAAAAALPEELNFAALADPSATTAVFMGKRTFPELARRLITAGLPANTPAMLAESVSHPDQRLTRTTVAELADLMATEDSSTPALILYGALAAGRP